MGDMCSTFLSLHFTPLSLDLLADSPDPSAHDILGMGTGVAVDNGPDLFAVSMVSDTDRRLELLLL
tara:strand:- start:1158 stop:1355 length:198 start_codon:yes stop_codon:yes gene_type:complete